MKPMSPTTFAVTRRRFHEAAADARKRGDAAALQRALDAETDLLARVYGRPIAMTQESGGTHSAS